MLTASTAPILAALVTVAGSLILALVNRAKRPPVVEGELSPNGVPHGDAYTQVIMDLLRRNDRLTKQVRECHEERQELKRRAGGAER